MVVVTQWLSDSPILQQTICSPLYSAVRQRELSPIFYQWKPWTSLWARKFSLSVKSHITGCLLGCGCTVHVIALLNAYSCVAVNEWFFSEGNHSIKKNSKLYVLCSVVSVVILYTEPHCLRDTACTVKWLKTVYILFLNSDVLGRISTLVHVIRHKCRLYTTYILLAINSRECGWPAQSGCSPIRDDSRGTVA